MIREFTEKDWMVYRGAEEFGDGSAPLVGEYGPLVVLIDNTGLQAWVDEYWDDAVCLGRMNMDYMKDVAERILADCKGLSPRQMIRHLQSL